MAGALDDPLLTTYGRLVEAHARLERALGPALEASTGLPLSWFEVLLRLGRSEGGQLTMGELAGQVALTTGGVTRLVDRIEAAGYVERRPCATDRRVSFTALTGRGREVLEQAAGAHADHLRQVFGGLSRTDRAALDRLLDRLREAPLPGDA